MVEGNYSSFFFFFEVGAAGIATVAAVADVVA
jgi:hypothetical protein